MATDELKRSDTNRLYDEICDTHSGAIKDADGKNIGSGGKMHFFLMLESITRLQNYMGGQIVDDMRAYVREAARRYDDNHNSGPSPYIVPSKPVFRFYRDRMFNVDWEPRDSWERRMLKTQTGEKPET